MNRILTFILLAISLWSCGTVPISGRRTVNLVSESQILQQSAAQYAAYVREMPQSTDLKKVKRVKVVCQNIAQAATQYLMEHNEQELAKQMHWEFNVINDRRVNAFCMPGGKIVIYTGILSLCDNDDELATVISHEVSHAIARHSNERLSVEILRQLGGELLSLSLRTQSSITDAVIQQAYGLGSQMIVSLPYSRKHEYEADQIGLVFMALAGYNPEYAVSFWQKMSQQGKASYEIFSTHPSDENRVKAIQAYLPQAQRLYKPKR